MALMSELVGKEGAYPLLCKFLERGDIYKKTEIMQLLDETSISDNFFSELVQAGLIIGTSYGFLISSLGTKVTLLLRALNGEDNINSIFNNFVSIYPSLRPYELITSSITEYFINNLYDKPNFIRINICSPWIRLEQSLIDKINNAVIRASATYPQLQIQVITVPLNMYHNQNAGKASLSALMHLGAVIVTNPKLHAKLYIVEPGPLGGSHYAILGSENLTGRGNIELAIKIENDNDILRKLEQYYFDIWQTSHLLWRI